MSRPAGLGDSNNMAGSVTGPGPILRMSFGGVHPVVMVTTAVGTPPSGTPVIGPFTKGSATVKINGLPVVREIDPHSSGALVIVPPGTRKILIGG